MKEQTRELLTWSTAALLSCVTSVGFLPYYVTSVRYALQRYCTKKKKIFPERKLRGLSPNFYMHTCVSDLYIPTIGLLIWLQQNRGTDHGIIINHLQMYEYGNWLQGRAV
jgi:hypothetical protein